MRHTLEFVLGSSPTKLDRHSWSHQIRDCTLAWSNRPLGRVRQARYRDCGLRTGWSKLFLQYHEHLEAFW